MSSWNAIDEDHSHCKECGGAFRNIELSSGICGPCVIEVNSKRNRVLSRTETKVVAKATTKAAQFLASMQEQGKTGASMPRVFDAFWKSVGGEGAFGDMMSREFKKSMGEGLTQEDLEGGWKPSPKLVHSWFELAMRHAAKTDEGKTLDVGSLEESDLEAILADVGRNAVKTDPTIRRIALMSAVEEDAEFRREAFLECIHRDPKLAEELLEKNGVLTVEGVSAKLPEKKIVADNNIIEDTVYDPTEDEYSDE